MHAARLDILQSVAKQRNKCQFRLSKLTFFGHDLSRQGVAPSEEKVAAILNANPLQDASQVRSFVQLVQYSAKFLPNFAQEAEPLMIRSLLRKNEPFIWGEAQERSLFCFGRPFKTVNFPIAIGAFSLTCLLAQVTL